MTRPLTSHEVTINLIAATTTRTETGLRSLSLAHRRHPVRALRTSLRLWLGIVTVARSIGDEQIELSEPPTINHPRARRGDLP